MSSPTISPASLARLWLGGWGHLSLLVTNLLTGLAAITLSLLTLAAVLSIPGGGIGLVLVIPALYLAWWAVRLERHRIVGLTGVPIDPPQEPVDLPLWRQLWLDPRKWRAVAYLGLHSLWGTLVGTITVLGLGQLLALAAMPLYADRIPDDGLTLLWFVPVQGRTALAIAWAVGVLGLLALPVVARFLARVDITMARWLIGRDRTADVEQLEARVGTLTESRLQAVDSVEAERQRIERDLHDGPQQRLVAIAMGLGMAQEAMHRDPSAAASLIDEAHASAKEAIVEMRNVARGIVPPVLADRGLDAAISALAARSPVPVTVQTHDVGRLAPTIEAIAYFVVSESLTNVAKHSGASRADVVLERVPGLPAPAGLTPSSPAPPAVLDQLRITVRDDGRGGATPGRGTGLTGLRHRVGAVDGTLDVHSPEGGPTTLVASLPLRPETTHPTTHGAPS